EQHLELVVMLQAHRVFAIAAVGRTAARLHVSCVPAFRAYRAQKGRRMKRAGPYFDIEGLHDDATVVGPELLQGENQSLEGGNVYCLGQKRLQAVPNRVPLRLLLKGAHYPE